jgi:prophage antirepressor-like protein
MTAIVPHIFEDNLVRSIMRDDEPWFVGRDVCHVLGIVKHHQALERLDDDERGTCIVGTPGGEQTMTIVSEPGIFRLIFTSRKPEAERFKRWLAHEVLPKLRRDGHYGAAASDREPYTDRGEPFSITAESVTVLKTRIDLVSECRRLHGHEKARALWAALGLPLPPAFPPGPVTEARDCFLQLLMARDMRGAAVHHLIDLAMDEDEDARMRLKIIGVLVDPGMDGVIVANRSAWLNDLYRGTQWADGRWRHGLRRLPGAQGAGTARRFPGYVSRGTFVPAEHLDFVDRMVT